MANTAEKTEKTTRNKRILKGTVISAKMEKTVVVLVERKKRHPLYLKVIKVGKKYHAHDEKQIAKEGDFISIIESRPLSKTKRWRVKEILERAK
jgi:small subunit ribosomal protein S17